MSRLHGPLSESRVSRRSEKLFFFCTKKVNRGTPDGLFGSKILSFSDLLETLDSDRGPWDLDLSAKMETLPELIY